MPDLTGETFGRLTVLRRAERIDAKRNHYWDCQCDCGNVTIVRGTSLRCGDTKSCGCWHKECAALRGPENVRHGCAARGSQIKEYVAWRDARHWYPNLVPVKFEDFYRQVGPAPAEGKAYLKRNGNTFAWAVRRKKVVTGL